MRFRRLLLTVLAGWSALVFAQTRIPWDMEALSKPPKTYAAAEPKEDGVTGIFLESVPWKGKPTRVFAWYGVPATGGKKVPGMVLIHGGGGTAFAEWVRFWNRHGYAAVAMDTCGSIPRAVPGKGPYGLDRPRHELGGPPGWGGFDQIDAPLEDQWTYHAVASAILSHSFLRSQQGVDPKRIGLTGISWGGYLTSIVGSVDQRFRFAAPVYGCGFLGEDSAWLPNFEKMGKEKAQKWLSLWDPSVYLPRARAPFLWVNGTNDFAYPMPSYQKSYRLPQGPRTLAIRVRMPHSHPPGVEAEEIRIFADSIFTKGKPLARVVSQGVAGKQAWATYKSSVPMAKAEINFTKDGGVWKERKWETLPAQLDSAKRRAAADIPEGARVFYLNLFDSRGAVVSTEHVEQ